MELIKNTTKIDFMGMRYFSIGISWVLCGLAIWVWMSKGDDKYGIDFRGGNEYVVKFAKPVDSGVVRKGLSDGGFKEAIVQVFDNQSDQYSLRLGTQEQKNLTPAVREILGKIPDNSFQIIREDFVGPVIGEQIRRDALLAGVFGLAGIMLYVIARFNLAFAIGAVVALFHDAIIAAGATVLSGREVGAATLAAVLTIIGYSVNDTIIVYDRIRENLHFANKSTSAAKKAGVSAIQSLNLAGIINLSINETLSRTIITSMTVVFVALTLWLFGGSSLSDLAFTLLVGLIAGTYSSIFVASPIVWGLERSKKK